MQHYNALGLRIMKAAADRPDGQMLLSGNPAWARSAIRDGDIRKVSGFRYALTESGRALVADWEEYKAASAAADHDIAESFAHWRAARQENNNG